LHDRNEVTEPGMLQTDALSDAPSPAAGHGAMARAALAVALLVVVSLAAPPALRALGQGPGAPHARDRAGPALVRPTGPASPTSAERSGRDDPAAQEAASRPESAHEGVVAAAAGRMTDRSVTIS
jgi:hypothetical protein